MLNSKKIFYYLLFVFFLLTILLLLLYFYYADPLQCFSGSFYKYASWDYKIAKNINDSQIGIFLFFGWLIIFIISIILGLIQKGIPRTIAIIIFLFTILLVSIGIIALGGTRLRAVDARRVVELESVKTALKEHYAKNKTYPGVSGSNQWDVLSRALGSKIPQDLCYSKNPKWTYEYWVSPDGQKYVLKASLASHSNLPNNDLDGNILGASCGENGPQEMEYCISSSF